MKYASTVRGAQSPDGDGGSTIAVSFSVSLGIRSKKRTISRLTK